MKTKLIALNAAQARNASENLIETYLDIYKDLNDPFFSESRYRAQLDSHMRVPGWSATCAYSDNVLVGYIYGFPLRSNTAWWDGLITPMPPGFTHETGIRTFAVCELMVRKEWRRRGIASAIHDALLEGRPEERATLLAEPDNAAAHTAYARWGWTKVGRLRPDWGDIPSPTFDVLTRPIRAGQKSG